MFTNFTCDISTLCSRQHIKNLYTYCLNICKMNWLYKIDSTIFIVRMDHVVNTTCFSKICEFIHVYRRHPSLRTQLTFTRSLTFKFITSLYLPACLASFYQLFYLTSSRRVILVTDLLINLQFYFFWQVNLEVQLQIIKTIFALFNLVLLLGNVN